MRRFTKEINSDKRFNLLLKMPCQSFKKKAIEERVSFIYPVKPAAAKSAYLHKAYTADPS